MSKKAFVFVTASINMVGGIQFWLAGKTKYLESIGWDVFVFYPEIGRHQQAVVPSLNKYLEGQICELRYPPCNYPSFIRNCVLRRMAKKVGVVNDYDEIVIESHSAVSSQWAELLAAKLHGKHVLFTCSEIFHGPGVWYDPFIEFYNFKHKRKELAGEVNGELQKLFGGYKVVKPEEDYLFLLDDDPVHDVKNERIEQLEKRDWNICYIGRPNKSYVPNVLRGVATFASNHQDKRILFIIVGDCSTIRQLLANLFEPFSNVEVKELGNVVPIPKSLFRKTNVVIAGSGSARCAVYAGVPTILANPSNNLASGILGYDIHGDYIFCNTEVEDTFDVHLERVLVQKVQETMPYDFIPKQGPAVCTEQNLKLIAQSSQDKEYYPSELLFNKNYIQRRKMASLYFNNFVTTYLPFIKPIMKQCRDLLPI